MAFLKNTQYKMTKVKRVFQEKIFILDFVSIFGSLFNLSVQFGSKPKKPRTNPDDVLVNDLVVPAEEAKEGFARMIKFIGRV